ncbi:outer membrane protein assembly factor BamB family protein [Actinoplanes derwentensis]|nr:PQQ-binding-like beta-propeller repeat protein [Actinoplanes derwentensis]
MAMIELGDVSGEPAGGAEQAPEFRHGTARRMVLAALAAVCAVALGGSARPTAPLIRTLWSIPFSEIDIMTMTDGLVLVQTYSDGPPTLTAYDAVTGRARWNRPLGDQAPQVDSFVRGGVLLMLGEQEVIETDLGNGSLNVETFGGTITAVDTATGAELWRQSAGYHLTAGPDTVLLAGRGRRGAPSTLRLVRTRDGGSLWERPLPEGAELSVQLDEDRPVRVVTSTPDGLVTVLDYDDGVPTVSRRLPRAAQEVDANNSSSFSTAPGLLMESRTTAATSAVTAYRIDTLERLWSVTATTPNLWGQECGPVVCLVGENQFRAVDPITGRERWQGTGYPFIGMVPGNELIVVTESGAEARPVLTEAATGRPVGQPGRGWVSSRGSTTGFAVLINPLAEDVTQAAVSRFDLTTGRSTLLGTIDLGSNSQCVGTGTILACQNADRLVVNEIG